MHSSVVLLGTLLGAARCSPAEATSNSCEWAYDGQCDDRSAGGTGVCAYGTDAADCGNPGSYYGTDDYYGTGDNDDIEGWIFIAVVLSPFICISMYGIKQNSEARAKISNPPPNGEGVFVAERYCGPLSCVFATFVLPCGPCGPACAVRTCIRGFDTRAKWIPTTQYVVQNGYNLDMTWQAPQQQSGSTLD